MTPDEKKELKERLDKAADAERRIRRLEEAVENVTSRTTKRIAIPLVDGLELQYSDSDEGRFTNVCWSGDEPGIADVMHAALLGELQRRLREARDDLVKA